MTLRPGFPIRISTDQSLLAAPRGFSQRATSFIASQRQGIHQMPFSYLRFLALEAGGSTEHRTGIPQIPGTHFENFSTKTVYVHDLNMGCQSHANASEGDRYYRTAHKHRRSV